MVTQVPAFLELGSFRSILYNHSNEPQWEKYADFRTLTPREAVFLMHGLNPKAHAIAGSILPPPRLRRDHGSGTYLATAFFEKVSHRIEVAERDHPNVRPPAEWLQYAAQRGWQVCEEFNQLASLEPGGRRGGRHRGVWRQQEDDVIATIIELRHDPMNLPPLESGKPGVKKDVREKLQWEGERFDKTWERLLTEPVRIRYAEVTLPQTGG